MKQSATDTSNQLAPPRYLLDLGRAVAPEEAPSVLCRFPGACGVRDFLSGSLRQLSKPSDRIVWFTRKNFDDIRDGAACFGSLIIFNPKRFRLVQTELEHVLLGTNEPVTLDLDVTWVPPRLFDVIESWDSFDTPEKVDALIGPAKVDERDAMLENVRLYFSEVAAVIESSLPIPDKPWYQLKPEERGNILRSLGRKPAWSPLLSRS